MAINKIQYQNKVAIEDDPSVAEINKVTDNNMNEIKSVVNNNADEMDNYYTKTEVDNLIDSTLGDLEDILEELDIGSGV